jgi:small membrane protein
VLIQIILLVAIAIIAVLLTRSTAGARHQAVRRLLLAGFVVLAVLSVLFPYWLTVLARFLGVGRGADLLLYALVIAFLSSLATTYRTTGLLNRRITVLARKVALAEAALAAQEARSEQQEQPQAATLPQEPLQVGQLGDGLEGRTPPTAERTVSSDTPTSDDTLR